MTGLARPQGAPFAFVIALLAVAVAPAHAQVAPHQHVPAAPPIAQQVQPEEPPRAEDHAGMDMSGVDVSGGSTKMDMGRMQGGKAPPDARDSNDYADGYRNSSLPGYG